MSTGSPFLIQAADPQTHCVYFDIGSRTEMSFFTNTPCCKHLDHPLPYLWVFIIKPLAHLYLSQVNTPAVPDVFTTICLLISRLTILLTADYVFKIFSPLLLLFQSNSSLHYTAQRKGPSFVFLYLCRKNRKETVCHFTALLAFIVCREIMVIMSSTESILDNDCLPKSTFLTAPTR